jgi:hypothetical protein
MLRSHEELRACEANRGRFLRPQVKENRLRTEPPGNARLIGSLFTAPGVPFSGVSRVLLAQCAPECRLNRSYRQIL